MGQYGVDGIDRGRTSRGRVNEISEKYTARSLIFAYSPFARDAVVLRCSSLILSNTHQFPTPSPEMRLTH
jgi:hypothetical protein